MKIHVAAGVFPPLSTSEYTALVGGIRDHGLIHPIVVYKGAILDGRHRLKACEELNIKPTFREWTPSNGITAAEYVLEANLHHRHLNRDQQSQVLTDMLPIFEAEAKARQREHGGTAPGRKANTSPKTRAKCSEGRSVRVAAKKHGVSHTRLSRSKRLKQEAPKLAEKVKAGELSLSVAEREAFPTSKEAAKKDPLHKYLNAIIRTRNLLAGARSAESLTAVSKAYSRDDISLIVLQFVNFKEEIDAWLSKLRSL